jgi:hypothetical protein
MYGISFGLGSSMKSHTHLFAKNLLLGILLMGLSGCVKQTQEGNTQVFTYELWAPMIIFSLGFFFALPAGWLLLGIIKRLGWALMIIGPVASLIFAPSMLLDRATVDDQKFTLRTGIWGLNSEYVVNFGEIEKARFTVEKSYSRRRTYTHHYLWCDKYSGSSVKISLDNPLVEAAKPYFLKKISNRGISVVDEKAVISKCRLKTKCKSS